MKIYFFSLLVGINASAAFGHLTEREQFLVDHVQRSIELGIQERSKLSSDILAIDGMSSSKNRHFLNNLCTMPGTNYLEIGVWKGSTFISALYGNLLHVSNAVAIDNWSEFAGPKAYFLENCAKIQGVRYQFYESDCFAIDKDGRFPAPINIYFYDGEHTAEAQELAFTYFDDVFEPVFIAVIDDWNHVPVQTGTRRAFNKLGYTILFEQILPARFNGDKELWWNGLYVAVVKKAVA